jgi:hypothetical protein
MQTSFNSSMRQGSYALIPSRQSTATTSFGDDNGPTLSKTLQSSFKTPSKISKPPKRPRKAHLKILGPVFSHTTLAAHEAVVLASPFLSLPGEIRNMIYTYALSSETQCLAYDKRHGRFNVSGIGAGLLQTCHMVSRETMYMPLLVNTLVFSSSTGGGETEEKMLKCMGRIIRLGGKFGWRDDLDIKVFWARSGRLLSIPLPY